MIHRVLFSGLSVAFVFACRYDDDCVEFTGRFEASLWLVLRYQQLTAWIPTHFNSFDSSPRPHIAPLACSQSFGRLGWYDGDASSLGPGAFLRRESADLASMYRSLSLLAW